MQDTQHCDLPEPTTERAAEIRSNLSFELWNKRVREAQHIVQKLHDIEQLRDSSGLPWRTCVKTVDPELGWSCYLHRRRRLDEGSGPEWERLVDGRVPPKPETIPDEVRDMASGYREANPDINCARARELLTKRFGERGRISDSSLQRIWSEAGLSRPCEGDASRFEKVERLHGGGGLALLGAAALETGVAVALSKAALKAGRESAENQVLSPEATPETEGRDEDGKFTSEFNQAQRDGYDSGEADARWEPDEKKRGRRSLEGLQLLDLSETVLSHRMLAMGMVGLVTQRRGFDGLDGPRGAWLAAAGQTAYMPSTLDKTLRQLALLDVGGAMWSEYGRQWASTAQRWSQSGEDSLGWLVCYVDKTTDPYWTRKFALSGKVETTGRLQPCLSRVALCAGPGVPLFMSLCAGASSMKKELQSMLDTADELLGDGELERVTVVDSEAASIEMLSALCQRKGRFITVLKGMRLRTLQLKEPGEWEPHGPKDHIRTGFVILQGKKDPKVCLRLNVVQRRRLNGSHPTTTWFATDASWEELGPHQVVETYLSRWPNQEQVFRNGRNGLAMERSHGYGGEYVTHIALESALEQAEKKVKRANEKLEKASEAVESALSLSALSTETKVQSEAAKTAIKHSEKAKKSAQTALDKAKQEHQDLKTKPRQIYQRDTTRESIVTVCTLTVMMLIEYVLKEYFGGLRMEFRTFIEHFVNTPTTVRTTYRKVLYQFEVNPRNPERNEQLREACRELSSRRIRRNGRLLAFEVVDPDPGQSP